MDKCYNKLQIKTFFFDNTVLGLSFVVTLALYNCHYVCLSQLLWQCIIVILLIMQSQVCFPIVLHHCLEIVT
jgi:cytochrome c oxidase subunit IV